MTTSIAATSPSPATTSPGAGAPAPRHEHLYVIDLLRFAAAMVVLGYHLLAPSDIWGLDTAQLFTHPIRQFFRYGWMGVEFFFVISGFVICMSGWGRTIGQYFVSRVTRLLPAYVFAVLLTSTVLTLWPSPLGRPPFIQVLGNLTMVQGLVGVEHIDSTYWTLLIELKFYLLFSIVIAMGVTYRRVVLFCVLWTTGSLFAEASGARLLETILEPRYTPYFVAGITLHLIHRFGGNLLLWGMLGTSFLLAAVSLQGRVDELVRLGEHVNSSMALPFLALFLAVMTAAALGWFSWLRWRGLVTVGALTYPVYLLHQRIGHTVIRGLDRHVPAWLLLGALVAGVLLLAHLVHVLIERPLAPLLRRHLTASLQQVQSRSSAAGRHQAQPAPVPAVALVPASEVPSMRVEPAVPGTT